MYKNLMAEIESIRIARGYKTLEALAFIKEFENEFPAEVRDELIAFMAEGAKMFAPVKEAV
jgi:hypothetical protein